MNLYKTQLSALGLHCVSTVLKYARLCVNYAQAKYMCNRDHAMGFNDIHCAHVISRHIHLEPSMCSKRGWAQDPSPVMQIV